MAEALPDGTRAVDLSRAGLSLGRLLARGYDQLLAPLFARVPSKGVALAAVGGYGRGAVALRSDLDVRILVRDPADAEAVVDAVLYPLWDATFAVGHQSVLLADALDAAREDLTAATALLDFRFLAGDAALAEELIWRASGSLFSTSELGRLYARLQDEIAKRHERFGDSVYLLEPDVKNGAGGLRDLDVFRWAAAARYGSGELDALVRVGALVPREAQELGEAQEMLWRIRHLLHLHAGRRSDRLTFDEQEIIAPLLEFGSTSSTDADGGSGVDTEGVERFMSAYYRAARAVSRGVTLILTRATQTIERRRPKDESLGGGLGAFDGAITVKEADKLKAEPALAFRALAVALERDAPLFPYLRETIMSLTADAEWCERLRSDKDAKKLFVELVSTRRETRMRRGAPGSVLKEIHDLGLLTAMVPEFLPVVGRVHHDLYHVYTVDVHSVRAVERLSALARGDLAADYPLASRLAAEMARPSMLSFATLLHDVGKAIGGKDHSVRGAEMARAILSRLDLRPEEIEQAASLIGEHLTMYRLATRRDVDDPATVEELLGSVHGREGLRELYLLTVADVSTTSPTSMTSWKAHMLDELYLAADRALSGGAESEGLSARATLAVRKLAEARASNENTALPLEFLDAYLASMPERYVLSSSEQSILAHAELAFGHGASLATVATVPSSHPEAAELCVVAGDRAGLLAMITGALTAARLEVHAAQIYTRHLADGSVQAVDLFWVRDRIEGIAGVEAALPRLRRDLLAFLDGAPMTESSVARSPNARMRPGPRVPTRVTIDHRASPTYTVIEVTAQDRPGLLFAMSLAFFELGLSIAVAKINTEGARVADVFYVSEKDGALVSPGERAAEIEARLLRAAAPEPLSASVRPAADPV